MEPDGEIAQLREQLAVEQQRTERLEHRVAELIHERSQLYNELHVHWARQKASDLTDELLRFGIDIDSEDDGGSPDRV
ncbi:hypothetical protein [Microlunatus endophyticus]